MMWFLAGLAMGLALALPLLLIAIAIVAMLGGNDDA